MLNNRYHNCHAFCSLSPWQRAVLRVLSLFAIIALTEPAAIAVNITASGTIAGQTPEIVGYNSGHFMPNSNTADWWRFSGVNAARIFSTPTVAEASDDLAPWGDGVSPQSTFVPRRD